MAAKTCLLILVMNFHSFLRQNGHEMTLCETAAFSFSLNRDLNLNIGQLDMTIYLKLVSRGCSCHLNWIFYTSVYLNTCCCYALNSVNSPLIPLIPLRFRMIREKNSNVPWKRMENSRKTWIWGCIKIIYYR